MPTPEVRVRQIMATQNSLITRTQALRCGLSAAAIQRRVRTGELTSTEAGVYALAGVPWTWERHLAVVILSTRGSLASHRSAAVLHGVDLGVRRRVPLELSVSRHSLPRHDFSFTRQHGHRVKIHESLDLHQAHPVYINGVATTPIARLAVDLGSVIDFDSYRRAIGQLRRERRIDWPTLEATYRTYSARGRNGCGSLRDLLDLHYGQVGAPSEVVEIRCADLLVKAGLPEPVHQFHVLRPDGRTAILDLAYPELRVGIETEGKIHDDGLVRQADHQRRNNLLLAGWTMLHFTWEDVAHRPDYVVDLVRATLVAAAAREHG